MNYNLVLKQIAWAVNGKSVGIMPTPSEGVQSWFYLEPSHTTVLTFSLLTFIDSIVLLVFSEVSLIDFLHQKPRKWLEFEVEMGQHSNQQKLYLK